MRVICGGSFGGYGAGGKNTLSFGTRGATLGVGVVSCSRNLRYDGVVSPGGYPGCDGTLGAA